MFYGSPTLYPHLPLGGAIPINTMPNILLQAGEKNNQAGQYKAGDIIVQTSSLNGQYAQDNNKGFISTRNVIRHGRYNISKNDGAMALLMIPYSWANRDNYISQYNIDCFLETYGIPPYTYDLWIIRNDNVMGFSNGQYKTVRNSIYQSDGKQVKGYPIIDNLDNYSSGLFQGNTTFADATSENGWLFGKVKFNAELSDYSKILPFASLAVITQITTLMAKYDDYNSVLGSLRVSRYDTSSFDYDLRCAMQVSASIPIFSYDDIEGLYNYFKMGESGGVNEDDLKISDVDFATHWKIYVNGQRKPNIYVTMESPDIESYLANSSENKGGYSKQDFKIQYRIPTWEIDYASIIIGKSIEESLKEYELVNDTEDTYNNTRSTSWNELTDINYGGKNQLPTFSGAAGDNKRFYEMYAQLQFRVYLNENLFSAWCEFGIGYIGSPSVPDFSEMQNWGNVVSINDGSTVELIYDQLPDDVDDYEKPDDDFPPDGDTAPTGYSLDSALTTTYRVTLDQLQLLGQYLWGASFFDDIKLINNSPIENIVSCKKLPVNIPAGVARNIVLGNVTCPANGNVITNIPIIDVGTITYNGYYKNFLDYAPYTQLILFLPFCGFVNIDASAVTGKTLNIKYAIDVILGKCKAMVFLDGAYYMSVDGDLGIDIPLVASNRAQAESAFALQGIEAVAQGDLMGVLGAAVSTQYHSSRNGSYTPTVAWQETRKCFLIADIPTVQYPSSYGHDVGYPCMLTRTLATMSGFTVCSEDIDMSGFNCTAEEMDMIKQILTTGIYL